LSTLVVLITGALSGIGRATAIAFAKERARLVVSGRNESKGEAFEAERALRPPRYGRQQRWHRAHPDLHAHSLLTIALIFGILHIWIIASSGTDRT